MGADVHIWKLCNSTYVLGASMDECMVRYCNILFVETIMVSTSVMWILYLKGTPVVDIGIGGVLFSGVTAWIFMPKFWIDQEREGEEQ